jgi:Glycosyl transferase family 2
MSATRAKPSPKGGAPSDVDVIVTTHNDGPRWREIADRLSTRDIHRLVIVDEGSTDVETKEVLGQLEAQGHQVVRQDYRGRSQARNLGLRTSTAPFLLFVDVDTVPDDGFLAAAPDRMIDEASIGVVYADGMFLDTDDPIEVGEHQPSTLVTDAGFEPFALLRRAAIEAVGGWDEQLETSQDRDLFLTLTEAGWGFTKLGSIGFTRALRPAPPLPSAGRVADEVRVADKHHQLYVDHLPSLVAAYEAALDRSAAPGTSGDAAVHDLIDQLAAARADLARSVADGAHARSLLADVDAARVEAEAESNRLDQELTAIYATKSHRLLQTPRRLYGAVRTRGN